MELQSVWKWKSGFKSRVRGALKWCLLASLLLIGFTGCATTESRQANSLVKREGTLPDLTSYQSITVSPWIPSHVSSESTEAGEKLAENVAGRLQNDFGGVHKEVTYGAPAKKTGELVVTGALTEYEPGSRFGRFMLIGVTPAKLKGNLLLMDGASGQELLRADFSKLWAWGGMMGAMKGMEEMMSETAAAISATVAEAKGWKPRKN